METLHPPFGVSLWSWSSHRLVGANMTFSWLLEIDRRWTQNNQQNWEAHLQLRLVGKSQNIPSGYD